MKISVICAVFNREKTIKRALRSIKNQTHTDIECIVVDGASSDNTLSIATDILGPDDIIISEADKGVYDALNKGLSLASGDVIAFLHSDDLFANDGVLKSIVDVFEGSNLQLVYGDVEFFAPGNPHRTIRYYKSKLFSKKNLSWGHMPAHPAMFFRKEIYRELEGFKTDYKIAADYEFLCRLTANRTFTSQYLSKSLVRMQLGGLSTAGLKNMITLNKEVRRGLNENGIYTNYAMILSKYPRKILGFLSP